MNQRLKDYLEKCSPATVDESELDDLFKEMDEAVPDIVKTIRQREELAAALRIAASQPFRSRQENED